MKIRNLLFGFVLSVMVLCVGSFRANTAQAFGCTTFCANGYNSCMIDCNGDATCQHQCWVDWECCKFLCDGSGTCQ
jgi:hypothetical protein